MALNLFYGTSKNGEETQIWTVIPMYVLVAIIKKELRLEASPYTTPQNPWVTAFEQLPIKQVLSNPKYRFPETRSDKQLLLVDL